MSFDTHVVRADADDIAVRFILGRVERERRLTRSDRHIRLSGLERPGERVRLGGVEVHLDSAL